MVFSMPAWAKTDWVNTKMLTGAWLALVMLITMPLAQGADGAGIKVRDVNTVQIRGQVILTAQLKFDLSEEALKALEHGVAIDIVIEMEALRQRRWLWDKTVVKHSERFSLERQALSNHYLVTHNYQRQSFLSLHEALDYIGHIRDYPLLKTEQLKSEHQYQGRLRAWLDIESLPAPMRPTAHISSHWHIASTWHEWPIES